LGSEPAFRKGGGAGSSREGPPRQHERFEVRLAVRFREARSFVEQYAHNLSRGGLYVAGAHDLEIQSLVPVELDLPGFASYEIQCRVVHVVGEEEAQKRGVEAGAGLAIEASPTGFSDALTRYLKILGGRKDALVLVVASEIAGDVLGRAGYTVRAAPPPDAIAATVLKLPNVMAVVVPEYQAAAYREGLGAGGRAELIVPVAPASTVDDLLNDLDRLLLKLPPA
jgi:hypothetical protein